MEQELYVWDTELTVPRCGVCYAHVISKKDKPRLTDGKRHPVTVIKPKEPKK